MSRLTIILMLILSFFMSNQTFANDVYKELNFAESDKVAEKILYDYVLEYFKWTPSQAKESNVTEDSISAMSIKN